MKIWVSVAFSLRELKLGPMLFAITSVVDFLSTAVSLWLALYLLGRGFSAALPCEA